MHRKSAWFVFLLGAPFNHPDVAITPLADRFGVVRTSAECIASAICSVPLRAEVRSTSFSFAFSLGAEVGQTSAAFFLDELREVKSTAAS
jgi:hypothetical protein